MSQKPPELILARNLISALSTPAFLVEEGGLLVFYNEAAGTLLDKGFDEVGHLGPGEWGGLFGPYTLLVLDPGTGIRGLGMALAAEPTRVNLLLTHLHLDHIQGLAFFAPLFSSQAEVVVWGRASPEASLRDRIARYISAPLSPVEVRELPCDASFRGFAHGERATAEWEARGGAAGAVEPAREGASYEIDLATSDFAIAPVAGAVG